jgi:hypothetical protein
MTGNSFPINPSFIAFSNPSFSISYPIALVPQNSSSFPGFKTSPASLGTDEKNCLSRIKATADISGVF